MSDPNYTVLMFNTPSGNLFLLRTVTGSPFNFRYNPLAFPPSAMVISGQSTNRYQVIGAIMTGVPV